MRLGKVSEWAALKGFSRQNAYKIIKRHGIPYHDEAKHLIDMDVADQILEASKNPSKVPGGLAGGAARQDQGTIDFDQPEEETAIEVSSRSKLADADYQFKLLRVQRERLTLGQISRQLVPLAGVRAFYSAIFSMQRTLFLSIGSELQDELAAEADPLRCKQLVDSKIRRALSQLAEWTGQDDRD